MLLRWPPLFALLPVYIYSYIYIYIYKRRSDIHTSVGIAYAHCSGLHKRRSDIHTSVMDCLRTLQWVAVGCSGMQCVAVGCSVLQCVAVCCSGLQWNCVIPHKRRSVIHTLVTNELHAHTAMGCNGLQWVAVELCNSTHTTFRHFTAHSATNNTLCNTHNTLCNTNNTLCNTHNTLCNTPVSTHTAWR